MDEINDTNVSPEESVEETIDNYDERAESEESQDEPEQQEEVEEGESQDEPELTEKGTKLDPNPQSAVHQQLANERRARQEYEQKAKAYEAYLQGLQANREPEKPSPFIDPSKLQTAEDVAQAISQVHDLAQGYKKEIESLKSQLTQSSQAMRESQNYDSLSSEIQTVKGKFPELDSNSKSYNETLDKKITSLYAKVAYDPNGRLLTNRVSLSDFAEPIMEAIRLATGDGSKQAQTRVVQKSLGKIQTKQKSGSPSTDLSPEESLEAEMAKIGF